MPESPNIEIAHRVHEAGEKHAAPARRHEAAIEIGEAFLLAPVAIATAWSGYQSALWDGRSVKLYGTSSRIRISATQNTTRGGQQQLYDATTFNFWLQARLTGKKELARDYEKRFRPEYRPAFHAWLATDPFTEASAPAGPIFMPQYHNALSERGARLNTRASEVFEEGLSARETGEVRPDDRAAGDGAVPDRPQPAVRALQAPRGPALRGAPPARDRVDRHRDVSARLRRCRPPAEATCVGLIRSGR
jgi:hypothetical protein